MIEAKFNKESILQTLRRLVIQESWNLLSKAMSSRNLTYIKENVCLYVNKNGETRAIQVHV
jgi:hypothetical protein